MEFQKLWEELPLRLSLSKRGDSSENQEEHTKKEKQLSPYL